MRKLQSILLVIMLVVVGVIAFKQQQLQQQMQQLLMPKSTQKYALGSNVPATGVSSYSTTVSKTAPAVVNIFTTQKVEQHPMLNDPVFK
jgi:S1-C subfamily serine protease